MKASSLVVSDINRFEKMIDFWDRELTNYVDNPFISGSMIAEHWKLNHLLENGQPFVMFFLFGNRVAGVAPLLMKSSCGLRHIRNFDFYICPEFFLDEYRETFFNTMIDHLFGRFGCESLEITFEDESDDLRELSKVCRQRQLNYQVLPKEGRAIIPVKTSLASFRKSLDNKERKEFRRIKRKIDEMGVWQISPLNVDCGSLDKIRAVERNSWKSNLTGRERVVKDLALECILNGVQRINETVPFFEPKIWTLDLNNTPIAYVIVVKRNNTIFLVKTSFDSRFRKISPGKFLMNYIIEGAFRDKTAEAIDFISNLQITHDWKPLVKKRTAIRICRYSFLSKASSFVFRNRISLKALTLFEQLKSQRGMIAKNR